MAQRGAAAVLAGVEGREFIMPRNHNGFPIALEEYGHSLDIIQETRGARWTQYFVSCLPCMRN